MTTFLKIECKRIMRSYGFWVSVLVGLIISISQYFTVVVSAVKYLESYKKVGVNLLPHHVFNNWIGNEAHSLQHFVFFMIIPLLCVLPWATSLYHDLKSGLATNYYLRTDRKKYYASKYIVTFMTGAFVVSFPLMLNLYLTSITLPSLVPEVSLGVYAISSTSMFADIFYSHPYIYCFLYLLIIFIFSGLISTAALSIGLWVNNSFTVLVLPFVIYLFLYTVCQVRELAKFVPFHFLDPDQGTPSLSFVAIVAEAAILLMVSLFGMYKGVKRDAI